MKDLRWHMARVGVWLCPVLAHGSAMCQLFSPARPANQRWYMANLAPDKHKLRAIDMQAEPAGIAGTRQEHCASEPCASE